MVNNVIAFPQGRTPKSSANTDTEAALDASISRHPAGNAKTPVMETDLEAPYSYIGVKQILPAGMQVTNIQEIDYRIRRLDVALENLSQRTSETDMARITQFIREALVTTGEITYFEGLAEGYTSYEVEEDEDN